MSTTKLLNAVIATGAGLGVGISQKKGFSIQSSVAGTGAVSATVLIQVSNSAGADWDTIATQTLSGTTRASYSTPLVGPYDLVRANVSVISGTGAAVTSTLSTV